MTPDEILRLTRDTRAAQRAYFKTRSKNDLIRSRSLESQLDKELNDYFNPQTKLFDQKETEVI